MSCLPVQARFTDYLDGAISGRDMQALSTHLDACAACRAEFDSLRTVDRILAAAGTVKAPADLGLRLRLTVSHEIARRQGRGWIGLVARWENFFRPALLQASAGFAGAVVLIGTLALLIGVVAAPQAVLANDEPLGALTTPHYLYSAAPLGAVSTPEDTTIVIEAQINSAGKVYDYSILSGPSDAATDVQVRDQLLLQVYEPARVFGQPVKGEVLITFSGVSVHG